MIKDNSPQTTLFPTFHPVTQPIADLMRTCKHEDRDATQSELLGLFEEVTIAVAAHLPPPSTADAPLPVGAIVRLKITGTEAVVTAADEYEGYSARLGRQGDGAFVEGLRRSMLELVELPAKDWSWVKVGAKVAFRQDSGWEEQAGKVYVIKEVRDGGIGSEAYEGPAVILGKTLKGKIVGGVTADALKPLEVS